MVNFLSMVIALLPVVRPQSFACAFVIDAVNVNSSVSEFQILLVLFSLAREYAPLAPFIVIVNWLSDVVVPVNVTSA